MCYLHDENCKHKDDGEAGSINSDSIYMTELPHRMLLSQAEFRLFDVT
jgi:hypothetical protein